MSPATWSAASHDAGVFCYGVSAAAFGYGALCGGEVAETASVVCSVAFVVGALVQFLGPRLLGDHYSAGSR